MSVMYTTNHRIANDHLISYAENQIHCLNKTMQAIQLNYLKTSARLQKGMALSLYNRMIRYVAPLQTHTSSIQDFLSFKVVFYCFRSAFAQLPKDVCPEVHIYAKKTNALLKETLDDVQNRITYRANRPTPLEIPSLPPSQTVEVDTESASNPTPTHMAEKMLDPLELLQDAKLFKRIMTMNTDRCRAFLKSDKMGVLNKTIYFRIFNTQMNIGQRLDYHLQHIKRKESSASHGDDLSPFLHASKRISIELALAGIEIASAYGTTDDVEKYVLFLNAFTCDPLGRSDSVGAIFDMYKRTACLSSHTPSLHYQCISALDKLSLGLRKIWKLSATPTDPAF